MVIEGLTPALDQAAAAIRRSAAGFPGTIPWARDLGHLEDDVAAMAHDLGADLDELLPQARQRPTA